MTMIITQVWSIFCQLESSYLAIFCFRSQGKAYLWTDPSSLAPSWQAMSCTNTSKWALTSITMCLSLIAGPNCVYYTCHLAPWWWSWFYEDILASYVHNHFILFFFVLGETYRTILTIYAHDKDFDVPTRNEVLICNPKTRVEEVSKSWIYNKKDRKVGNKRSLKLDGLTSRTCMFFLL